LTLSPRPWIPSQSALSGEFGLSPLEDQQLAGLLMWMPMGAFYTAAALFFAYHWLTSMAARAAPPHVAAQVADCLKRRDGEEPEARLQRSPARMGSAPMETT
jgi:cytochrome c oxidase assembly factor CtaG